MTASPHAPFPALAPPTAGVGTAASPEGGRVDFSRLRAERRARLLTAMDTHGLDAVVLGRPANVVYASGARQLWTAGARPFGPACVVVRGTGAVHLLSVTDEGVPPEIPHDHLYGLSWNPLNLIGHLRAVPGLADAARVGTDGLTPGFGQFLGAIAPGAAVVDANPALGAARAAKTPDELACIATATAIAESSLSAMEAALRPGVSERQLLGVHLGRIAALGVPTPPTEGVVCATPRRGPVSRRRLAVDRLVGPGELVVLDPGALYAGYEGGVGRTRVAGPGGAAPAQERLGERCRAILAEVISACRVGASGADLGRAWEATGEPAPESPFVSGVGLGAEPPLMGGGCGADAVLVAGSVVAVEAWVTAEGAGGFLEREIVAVTDTGPEVLSRSATGPARSRSQAV